MLKFVVVDSIHASKNLKKQHFLGEANIAICELIDILGRKTLIKPLVHPLSTQEKRGFIVLRTNQAESSADVVHLELSAMNLDSKDITLFVDNTSPFIVISKPEKDAFTPIYTSEVSKGVLNVSFKPIFVSMHKLCDGDRTKRFRIEFWSYKKSLQHDLIGVFDTNLETLQKNVLNATLYPLINEQLKKEASDYRNSGSLCVQSVIIEKRSSFLDYITGGMLLDCSFAIDFSKKNIISENINLHAHDEQRLNDYQKCVLELGEIFDTFTDQKYSSYGFGAQLPNHEKSSQSFPINFASDARVKGVDGFMRAYDRALSVIQMHEPANFAPVISLSSAVAENNKFQVLVILTSCVCDDLDETLHEIGKLENTPLFIAIIGVGTGDFSKLEELNRFKNVKFIVNDGTNVAKRALKGVPNLFLSFMRKNNIIPQSPRRGEEEEEEDEGRKNVVPEYKVLYPVQQVDINELPYAV
jgi:hypothetical protein